MSSVQPRATPSHAPAPREDDDRAQLVRSPLLRAVYLVLGFIFLGIGIAGYIIPLLPGTVNILIATFFFFRSSERMYHWVLDNRFFGHLVRDYRAGLGIPRKIKVIAIGMIVASFAVTIGLAVSGLLVRLVLVAIAVAVSAFVLTRPTRETVLGAAGS